MASGRDADVYALDAHRVLRRYRDGADATAEAAVMGHLGALGYPVPHVYSVDRAAMVLERLDGPTMLHALATGEISPHDGARQLADLQTRLHALPPRTSTNTRSRTLHGDLHPGNVMLTSRGPVVIDWRNTTEGPPELDVALSAVIMAQVAVDSAGGMAGLAHAFLTAFLAHSEHNPLAMLTTAVSTRRGDPNLTETEVSRLDKAASLIEALNRDS
jgi:aminoglycoside phosphotransferase (APT) family kinase protein